MVDHAPDWAVIDCAGFPLKKLRPLATGAIQFMRVRDSPTKKMPRADCMTHIAKAREMYWDQRQEPDPRKKISRKEAGAIAASEVNKWLKTLPPFDHEDIERG